MLPLFLPLPHSVCSLLIGLHQYPGNTVSNLLHMIGLLANHHLCTHFAYSRIAGTAALLYRKKRTQGSAIAGLFGGALLMTVLMLLWNYLITPLYMHTARADVAAMLVPVFLPFNLLKGCLNATITVLLYKPVVQTVCRSISLPLSSYKA